VAAPRIVAELGRPETPEETAARKAENSRAHRANQTTRNLVLALLASLAIVLFVVLVVVRPSNNLVKSVDYRTVAAQAQPSVDVTLAAPALPKSWRSNAASLQSGNGTTSTWYVGLLTPKNQYIGIEEGIDTPDTWLGSLLGKAQATGHATMGGLDWTIYDQRSLPNTGNYAYALAASDGHAHFVLHGSAGNAEFEKLATAVGTEFSSPTATN
jgi:hypothetical protein